MHRRALCSAERSALFMACHQPKSGLISQDGATLVGESLPREGVIWGHVRLWTTRRFGLRWTKSGNYTIPPKFGLTKPEQEVYIDGSR